MRHIMFDIETTDVESTAVILSCAMIEFKLEEKPVFQDLVNRAYFFKFDAKEQISQFKRTVDKATMEWWSKRPQLIREVSLTPKSDDLKLLDGIEKIRIAAHCQREMKKNFGVTFWQRGGLDQLVFESLCRSAGVPVFSHYSNWRDVRTAIELLNEGAVHGYVEVPGCHQDTVHKHNPVHDCAYDIMQLLLNNLKVGE